METLGTRVSDYDILLFNEFFEATHDPAHLLEGLAQQLAPQAVVAVAFANIDSLPSRVLRRRWKSFFDHKIGYFNADNLEILMWRSGFRRTARKSSRHDLLVALSGGATPVACSSHGRACERSVGAAEHTNRSRPTGR